MRAARRARRPSAFGEGCVIGCPGHEARTRRQRRSAGRTGAPASARGLRRARFTRVFIEETHRRGQGHRDGEVYLRAPAAASREDGADDDLIAAEDERRGRGQAGRQASRQLPASAAGISASSRFAIDATPTGHRREGARIAEAGGTSPAAQQTVTRAESPRRRQASASLGEGRTVAREAARLRQGQLAGAALD